MLFLGTQISGSGTGQNPNPNLTNGFITAAGIKTSALKDLSSTAKLNYGLGSFGMFDPKTWLSKAIDGATSCCPLVLVGAAIYSADKIGPFHGGYQESQKSKIINPKLVTKFYRVDPCAAQAQVTHIGRTKYTKSLSPANAACAFEFLCGETYTLHIEARGAPALRFLNHQAYRDIDAYTGCCPDGAPLTVVDSTLVMILWANAIINDPILKVFYDPIVYTEAGVALYKPGTTGQLTWDNYVSPGHVSGLTAGLRLAGSYVDTKFGSCTFQVSDYFNVEPVITSIEMVDLTGDPCTFTGICVVNECNGVQVMGTGEQVVRDLALSEEYRQNFLHSDLRIREITQGNQIVGAVSLTTNYTRYVIQHNIPRNANPTSTYDRDRYELHIISNGVNTAFEAFMNAWLSTCANCVSMEVFSCSPCSILTP